MAIPIDDHAKKEVEIKGLGKITISHCRVRDIIDVRKKAPTDAKRFTLALLSRSIRSPEWAIEKLEDVSDERLEVLGREWLSFEGYSRYLRGVDERNDIDFFEKFRLAIDAPEKEVMKTLQPLFRKMNSEMNGLKTVMGLTSVPLSSLRVPEQYVDFMRVMNSAIRKQIDLAPLGKVLGGVLAVSSIAQKSLEKAAQIRNSVLPNLDVGTLSTSDKIVSELTITPELEAVRAMVRVERSMTSVVNDAKVTQERLIKVISNMNATNRYGLRLQWWVLILTGWLVILTLILILRR